MFYYKVIEEDGTVSYEERMIASEIHNATEITEAEYLEEISKLQEEMQETNDIPSYEELEEENARLLYQLLTGEEFE